MEKDTDHRILLTHRTDLKDYAEYDEDKERTVVTHPRQSVSGILQKDDKHDSFYLEVQDAELGKVVTSDVFFDQLVVGRYDPPDSYAAQDEVIKSLDRCVGKPAEATIDEKGLFTTIRAQDKYPGDTVINLYDQYGPRIPFEAMPKEYLFDEDSDPVRGKLVRAHAPDHIELMNEKGDHVLVIGNELNPVDFARVSKMVGQVVEVVPRGESAQLQFLPRSMGVTSLENKLEDHVDQVVSLTHRKDLSDRTYHKIVVDKDDKKVSVPGEVVHPRQSVSGTVISIPRYNRPSYGGSSEFDIKSGVISSNEVWMDTDEFGVARVFINSWQKDFESTRGSISSNANISEWSSIADNLAYAESRGHRVTLSYDDQGKTLTTQMIDKRLGTVLVSGSGHTDSHQHTSPERPQGVVQEVEFNRLGRSAVGTLVKVHRIDFEGLPGQKMISTGLELLDTNGKHAVFREDYLGEKRVKELEKNIGKQIRITPDEKARIFQVVSLEKDKSLAR